MLLTLPYTRRHKNATAVNLCVAVFSEEEEGMEDPNEIGGADDELMDLDDELMDLVDSILQDEDGNNDGYIDYVEFLLSQGREINSENYNHDMDPKNF